MNINVMFCKDTPVSVVDFVRVFRFYSNNNIEALRLYYDHLQKYNYVTLEVANDIDGLVEKCEQIGLYFEVTNDVVEQESEKQERWCICPFCGEKKNLNEQNGVVQCLKCNATAPVEIWNERVCMMPS